MKKSLIILKAVFLSLLLAGMAASNTASAQNTDKQQKEAAKETSIKNLVDSQRYVFIAQTATPLSGRTRQLTSQYDLRVKKDTITAFLPYFGRAYTAPIGATEGGIKFNSKDFQYTLKEGTKGGWDVYIQTKDANDTYRLNLSISKSGYATLQVSTNNRQPISFYGYISKLK
jgi:hypothetical protein